MISRGIYSLLSSAPSIVAAAPGGVFPVLLPKALTATALTYQIVGGSSSATLGTSGLQKLRVQFDAWATSYDAAASLREALRELLNGYQGQLTDGTVLQNVDLIQFVDDLDQDSQQFRCVSEFYFFFNFTS